METAGCSGLPHHTSLVGNARRRFVDLGQIDSELLRIGRRSILQHADGHSFSQLNRCGRVSAPVNAGENSVTERDIIRQLVQFAIDRELTSIPARVRHERQPIVGRDQRIWDDEIAIEEEFQDGNASAGDCAVPGGVSRMSG